VGGDDQAQRTPDAADLLDRDRVGERVHAGAGQVYERRRMQKNNLHPEQTAYSN
jgi:hypothetical protein